MQAIRSKFSVLAIALVLVFSTTLAFGQGIVTGTISGTAVDPDGAVVSGATVTAKDAATNRAFTTTSDAAGAFALRGLPVGVYQVTIEAPGFKKAQISGVQVFVGRETAMGAQALTIGSEGEVVDVEGTAPLVEATTAQVSSSFESRKVTDIPVAGNNGFDALALLVPGAASAGDAGFSNNNGADVAVNGQRGRSNNFQIDGQSNNDNSVAGPQYFIGNPDIIAEFQIITNNYSAEFGRNMGSVVNYVTKSGTNNFHGTAFWFHSNVATSSLANEEKNPVFGFCAPGENPDPDGVPDSGDECDIPEKFDFRQNRFGGTLGGPIVADKLWFFGSFLDDRFRGAGGVASSGSAFTPTPAGLATLQAAFPGNPAVAALANMGPYGVATGNPTVGAPAQVTGVDNGPDGVLGTADDCRNVTDGVTTVCIPFAQVQRVAPARTDNREWVGRLDYQLSDKDRVFGRYLFQGANFASPTGVVTNANVAAGSWVDVPSRTHQVGLDWSRTWTSHFINQVRWSYSRSDIAFEKGSYGVACTRANLLECPSRIGFQDTSLAFGQQSTFPQGRLVNNTQFQDNASWVLGRHTVKFGGEYSRQRSPNIFLPNINGTYTFANFDAFLQGNPVSLSLTEGPEGIRFKEKDMALYIQDDWRVRDNLTLNLGLRWERFEQAINALNDLTTARESDPTQAFWDPALPLELRTVPQVPEDNNNFGPNVGFAWTPRLWEGLFGRDKTVIRGGYRIAYDPAFYNIFLNVYTSAPTVNAATIPGASIPAGTAIPAGGVVNGQSLRDAGIFALAPRGTDPRFRNQTTVADDFRNPYTQQWSLGIQRQVTSKIAAEVRYVGNHTIGNFQSLDANPQLARRSAGPDLIVGTADDVLLPGLLALFPNEVPAGVTMCTDPTAPGYGRIDCTRGVVRERRNSAFSIYHGLQSRLDVQNWHGFTAGAAYTWSKAIDNVSEIFSTFGGGNSSAWSQNPFNTTEAERGISGTSFPHVASLYWIYELPWFKNQEGVVGHILGGWQVNGTWRYQSGQAFNPLQFGANLGCDLAFSNAFNSTVQMCRPFEGNPNAPIDSVGACLDDMAPDGCGFGDIYTGAPLTPDDVRWIYNDTLTALMVTGTPYGVGRNILRGQSINNVDLGVYKNTKVSEKFTVQFQANIFNLFNRQFRGVADPFVEDFPLALDGSFMNTEFNTSNNRNMWFGLRFIF